MRWWAEVIVRSLFTVYVLYELRQVWRAPAAGGAILAAALGAALRVSLVLIVFVLTQTMDYYFIVPLAIAAVLGWRNWSARVGYAISILYLPTFYLRRMELEPIPNVLLVASLAGPLVLALLLRYRPADLAGRRR